MLLKVVVTWISLLLNPFQSDTFISADSRPTIIQ